MRKRDFRTGLVLPIVKLLLLSNVFASSRPIVVGAREAALAQSVVALPGPFSAFYNQALLADYRIPAISISLRQPFFIPGYQESALTCIIPANSTVFAFGVTQASVGAYRESNVCLALAKKLNGRLSAGLLFNYFFVNFPEDGSSRGSFQVDGGISYRFTEQLVVGFHVNNLVHTSLASLQLRYQFPVVLTCGVAYRMSEYLVLSCQALQEGKASFRSCYGLEVNPGNNFLLRGGLMLQPFQHSFGFGYVWDRFQLDFALVHHEILGYTPSFSLHLKLKSEKYPSSPPN